MTAPTPEWYREQSGYNGRFCGCLHGVRTAMRATERSPYPSWGCTGQAAGPPSRLRAAVSVQRNMRAEGRMQLAPKGRGLCTQACGRAAAAGQAWGRHRRAAVGPAGKIEDDARSPPAQGDRGAASHPMPDRRPCLHMHARVRRQRRGRAMPAACMRHACAPPPLPARAAAPPARRPCAARLLPPCGLPPHAAGPCPHAGHRSRGLPPPPPPWPSPAPRMS